MYLFGFEIHMMNMDESGKNVTCLYLPTALLSFYIDSLSFLYEFWLQPFLSGKNVGVFFVKDS